MTDLVPIRRALISVSDKAGLGEFARALAGEYGCELVSTGGTAAYLREQGLTVTDVAEVTNFPEMMDGRVKTLHPKIHGGLLALRDNPAHAQAMRQHDIRPIDLVCVNLYPFEQTVARSDVTFEEAIENIDIGGPSMVRSAAKNQAFVTVVTAPNQYDKVLGDLQKHAGSTCAKHRRKLARQAFDLTARYDAAIAGYLTDQEARQPTSEPTSGPASGPMPMAMPTPAEGGGEQEKSEMWGAAKRGLRGENESSYDVLFPEKMTISLVKKQALRYGENPHQAAMFYVEHLPNAAQPAGLAHARQLHGKELSYINLLDADAAMAVVAEFATPAACVVKHATPCGAATAGDLANAFLHAYACDPLAAFGGIVALNRTVDLATAQHVVAGQKFLEVIIAPDFDEPALELLRQRWKNTRLLVTGGTGTGSAPGDNADANGQGTADASPGGAGAGAGGAAISGAFALHAVLGGFLIQQRDGTGLNETDWTIATRRRPTDQELADLRVAWLVCKHVKSNAIVLAAGGSAVGIGGGQVDRVNAARVAIEKAGERSKQAVAASDAFFPFPDGPRLLLDAGVTALIHPGGSIRDPETIDLANQRDAAVVLTGQRHFRH